MDGCIKVYKGRRMEEWMYVRTWMNMDGMEYRSILGWMDLWVDGWM